MKNAQRGFTLIELMIVVAIIGILAAVAIPQYRDYTSRSKAGSVLSSLDAYKKAVSICWQERGTNTGCNLGTNGIPATTTTPLMSAVAVADGTITATIPINAIGNSTAGTIVMTPTSPAGSSRIKWDITSTGLPTAVNDALIKNN